MVPLAVFKRHAPIAVQRKNPHASGRTSEWTRDDPPIAKPKIHGPDSQLVDQRGLMTIAVGAAPGNDLVVGPNLVLQANEGRRGLNRLVPLNDFLAVRAHSNEEPTGGIVVTSAPQRIVLAEPVRPSRTGRERNGPRLHRLDHLHADEGRIGSHEQPRHRRVPPVIVQEMACIPHGTAMRTDDLHDLHPEVKHEARVAFRLLEFWILALITGHCIFRVVGFPIILHNAGP